MRRALGEGSKGLQEEGRSIGISVRGAKVTRSRCLKLEPFLGYVSAITDRSCSLLY